MKFNIKVLALGAGLLVASASAYADTVQLGSYGTGSPSLGNGNSALVFGASGTTYDIGTGGVWTGPIGNSSWVAQNVGDCPGCGNVEPNGVYDFFSTFTLANANYSGSIDVLADDTTDVYLNGILVQAYATGPNSTCQTGQPNCIVPLSVALPFGDFTSGTNTLEFAVHQTNGSAEGVDFSGSVSAVPEPGSLFLLGTGLIGSAGAMFRRIRRPAQ